ncbi:MAG: hypothetical protein FWB94_12425 [Chitinispirillia bacterium]|nr:hypothetical protein [Chitinispirillia bacterium]
MVTRVTQEKAGPKRLSKAGEWARAQDLLPQIGVSYISDEQAHFGEGGLITKINGQKCVVVPPEEWEPIDEDTKFDMLMRLRAWYEVHQDDENATVAEMRAVME